MLYIQARFYFIIHKLYLIEIEIFFLEFYILCIIFIIIVAFLPCAVSDNVMLVFKLS